MKYKIITDSSSNLLPNYIVDENVGFDVAPLTIRIGDNEYVDDEKINVNEMLDDMNAYKGRPTSACPSPYDYFSRFGDAEEIFIVTISKKLSGSFNSAVVAGQQSDKKVHVIDSKATGGTLILIAEKLYELMKEGTHSFEEIVKIIENYRDNLHMLFVLDKFDNLVKNGRMSKVAALIAKTLIIKPLCFACDGEIEVKEKIRTAKGVYKRLVMNIADMLPDTTDKECIIVHTQADEAVEYLRASILEKYKFKRVRIVENRGLNSFYALEKGLMVSFG